MCISYSSPSPSNGATVDALFHPHGIRIVCVRRLCSYVFPVQNVSDWIRLKNWSVPCTRYTCIPHVFLYLNWYWTASRVILVSANSRDFDLKTFKHILVFLCVRQVQSCDWSIWHWNIPRNQYGTSEVLVTLIHTLPLICRCVWVCVCVCV